MAIDAAKVQSIFIQAIECHSPEEWDRYLEIACGGDLEVRRRAEALLRAHEGVDAILDQGLLKPDIVEINRNYPEVTERPGTMIGSYKLLEQIGEGGFGIVFMAEQQQPVRRKVALKVLKPGMDTKQVVARFEAERQALAMMDHPHIAHVLDAGATDAGHPYFVMELVSGIPITEFSDRNRLSVRERLELFVTVCQAVQHAHQKGIIHRDLKPSNVLVTLLDGRPTVKVIDFGIAKALGQERLTEKTLCTGFAQMIGTPLYMSPEQAEMSGQDADTRTDIYALGVLLYELLTGTTPFGKERLKEASYDEIRRIIREEEPAKPSTRIGTLGQAATTVSANRNSEPQRLSQLFRGELDWIVMKALEKDRNRRYDTASGFGADVQRYLNDEPVQACPPSAVYRFRKFARRNKAALTTATAIAFAVLLAVIGLAASNILIKREKAQTERHLYAKNIALAEREWAANNFRRAEQLLEECPQHLRGWEWDYVMGLRRGNPLPFRGHTGDVVSVAFHPDGRRLVSAGNDGQIRVWDANTSQEIFSRDGREGFTLAGAAFSPDGRYLAGMVGNGDIKVWDATSGAEVCAFGEHGVQHLAYSPDSHHLASCSEQITKIWDVSSWHLALILEGHHANRYRKVEFSPDGRVLCSGDGSTVRLWNTATGELLRTLEGHTGEVKLAVFSRDGTRLASTSAAPIVYRGAGGEVIIWDARTGQRVYTLPGHNGLVGALAFSADGRRLASAGYDQTVKIWDLATGQEVLTLRGHSDWVNCLAFSADGRRLASASADKTVRLWDATPLAEKPAQELRTLTHHRGRVTSVTYSPDGRCLASTGLDQTVQICNPMNGKIFRRLEGHTEGVNRVVFSIDGKLLASASLDQSVKVWDSLTGQEVNSFRGHHAVVQDVAFGPDDCLASIGWKLALKVWEARTGKVFLSLERVHDHMIHGVTFSPNGRLLATAAHDMTVKIWDLRAGKCFHTIKGYGGRLTSVAFSPDGRLLASAGMAGNVRIIETSTWKEVCSLRGHTGWVWCVRFSRNSRRLASVGNDAIVHLWDVETGQEIRALHGHTDCIECVAFSPDGRQVATASWDGTVKIWDVTAEQDPRSP